MRNLLLFVAFLLPVSAAAQGTLSPAAPVFNQGTSGTISCIAMCGTGGAWTCPGCVGTLSGATPTSVTYNAPAAITPQQSIGGFHLYPNNHVFNTRVDSLPLRSDSATLMAAAGTADIIYHEMSFTPNYVDGSTPLVPMHFYYTPATNGNYQVPTYPNAKIQGGWLNAITNTSGGGDHHLLTVNTTTGAIQNIYQYFAECDTTAASVNGSNTATLICSKNPTASGFQSGRSVCIGTFSGSDTYFNLCPVTLSAVTSTSLSYPLTHGPASASTNGSVTSITPGDGCSLTGNCNSLSGARLNYSDYALPVSGATDAAGMEILGLVLHLQEMQQAIVTGGTIKHALRMTLQNGYICGSSTANACAGNAEGTRHIWPATAEAYAGGGIIPYGLRFRLKAAFDISTYSPIAQILLTQLKQYGLILSDGGTGWSICPEATKWPQDILAAMNEIESANIQGSTNFEVVDESGLIISSSSGETTNNRETVTYTSSSGVATVDVALMGVAVGLPNDQIYFQAGSPALQLSAFSNIGSVTWSMNNPVGTLTSGGLYTPPATDGTFSLASNSVSLNSSNVVENKNVSSAGSYAATVAVTGLSYLYPYAFRFLYGEWIEYMVALKSASAPYGAPPVQSRSGGTQTCSNSCTGGFTNNAASGNLGVIFVYDQSDATATISSATFACGTLTLDSNSPKRGATTSAWVYTVQLTAGTCGLNSVTITFNHSITASISATEFHNMAAASVVDCSAAGTGNGYIFNSGTCTTSNAADVIYAAGGSLVGSAKAAGGQADGVGFNPGGNYTTVTATSTVNGAVVASVPLTVLPKGAMRIFQGVATPFTDNEGSVWSATTGDDGGEYGCCFNKRGDPSWPATNDIGLYESNYNSWGGDMRFDIHVSNGPYQITGKFATSGGVGAVVISLEAQGIVTNANVDINVAAGGAFKPVDFVLTPTVSNGLLSFILRVGSITGGTLPSIASLQIMSLGTTLAPNTKVPLGMTIR